MCDLRGIPAYFEEQFCSMFHINVLEDYTIIIIHYEWLGIVHYQRLSSRVVEQNHYYFQTFHQTVP